MIPSLSRRIASCVFIFGLGAGPALAQQINFAAEKQAAETSAKTSAHVDSGFSADPGDPLDELEKRVLKALNPADGAQFRRYMPSDPVARELYISNIMQKRRIR